MTTTTTTAEKIAAFPRHVQDRAYEWVNVNGEIDDDDSFEEYDEAVLSACEEIAAIDEVNDRADRLAVGAYAPRCYL